MESAKPDGPTLEEILEGRYVLPEETNDPPFSPTIFQTLTGLDAAEVCRATEKVQQDLEKSDLTDFFNEVNSHLAKITVRPMENYGKPWCYATFYSLMKAFGMMPMMEYFVQFYKQYGLLTFINKNTVFIFDIVFDENIVEAFRTPHEYLSTLFYESPSFKNRQVTLVAMNFDLLHHNITDWKAVTRGKISPIVAP